MDTRKDLEYTHSVLNFVRANLVGQVIFHGVLKQLQSTRLDDSYVAPAHKAFEKLDPWIKDLYQGLPILSLSWTTPETFEAIRTFGILKDIKKDLTLLASEVEKALEADLSQDVEAKRLLIAVLARSANTRSAFLEGLHRFLMHHQIVDGARIVADEHDQAKELVRVSHMIFGSFNRPSDQIEPELYTRLKDEASLVPGIIRSQVHDANLMLNAYSPPFTFEQAEFSKAEADAWQDLKVTPNLAGYWRAFRFTPEECVAWFSNQMQLAAVAAEWRRAGFTPENAPAWFSIGFTAPLARSWYDAGFDPQQAATFASRGIANPELAPRENVHAE